MTKLEPTRTGSDLTATERLRELLDERGVEHRVSATGYSIDIGPNMTAYANRTDTTLDVSLRGFTPEQAIAATLGSCNCSDDCTNDCTNSERTETCHADETGRFSFHVWNGELVTVHVMECSECGGTYEHVNGDYEFCPRCGRKVVTNG